MSGWLKAAVAGLALAACSSPGAPAPVAPSPPSSAPPGGYDVVIEGGRIVDGTGNAWRPGDLGIRGDRIAALTPPGALRDAPAARRIDATGKVVAPGFIDIQSHSRSSFLAGGDGRVISKVSMGVTTEIMGESTTNAPASPAMLEASRHQVGVTVFETFGAWVAAMERHGASVNFGSFVGATTIRRVGMGDAMGAAGSPERRLMQIAVRQSMEEGAFGIASALIYPPGSFADTDELISINAAAAPYGGIYITHLRSEGDRLLEAIDEAIEIGTEAGVPVEIYHLKAAGERNWPKAALAVAKIDSARAAGVDIQANMYPYTAASTSLTACFPPWASANGQLYRNLASPDARARMRAEMETTSDWDNLCALASPEGTLLLGLARSANRRLSGRTLADAARALGRDWIDAALDLVLDERQEIATVFFMMSDENVAMQIAQPWIKFGTDAAGLDPDRPGGLAHPRAYGTFTRVLGRYVREERSTSLEDAVRKMSSAVAARLRIPERGYLREGWFADVVVFDPLTVADRATYEQPHQLSTGVEHVFVNGVAVLTDGRHTGALPGRALRGPGWTGVPAPLAVGRP